MASREIVTLQIGHYSNFVGSHWWNIQESSFVYDPKQAPAHKDVDHDVLFREGQNLRGDVTYTPRLVALDLKRSLKALKQEGSLYEHKQQEEINWSGDVTLHQSVTETKSSYLADLEKQEQEFQKLSGNPDVLDDVEAKDTTESERTVEEETGVSECVFGKKYYDLDNSVTVWSDYLKTHLHPKSVQIIEQYSHGNELQPFDIYGCGQEVISDYETRTEIEDRLHFFTEECDHLQGFHVLLDTYDGFGGIGSYVLQHLEDDYKSKGIFTFGLTPNNLLDDTPVRRANRILNSAISYSKCWGHSSLFAPLSLATSLWKTIGSPVNIPHLNYKSVDYHTSAILAASLDTVTSPYRAPNSLHIRDITDNFNSLGKKVASLSSSLPFPIATNQNLVECLVANEDKIPWVSVTPHVGNELSPFMQSAVLRGIPSSFVQRPGDDRRLTRLYSACANIEDILQVYLTHRFPSTMNAGTVLRDPCKVGTPFPHIFEENVNKDGFISPMKRQPYEGVDNVPLMTCLSSSPDIGSSLLKTLHLEASKLNIKKHHRFLEAGLEEDDYAEIVGDISALSHCYTNKSDMG